MLAGTGWSGMWSCHAVDPIFGETLLSVYFTDVNHDEI